MLTTPRSTTLKNMLINDIEVHLKKLPEREYTLKADLKQYREDTDCPYRLKYIREERDKVWVLGVCYWNEEEFDFLLEELYVEIVESMWLEITKI